MSETTATTPAEKLRYPSSVGYIVSNEFCERFNFYGMRTILVLYLTSKLHYTEEMATVVFHMFTMLVYTFPLFGAILADSYWGKFKTILYLSMIYTVGCVLMAFGALPFISGYQVFITMIGLVFIAVGTGGIKPCVSAFGGDQFHLPRQAVELAKFFSLFYFAINAGSMVSTTVTPILRADIHCFGENDCFSLAFGVPALLMIISVLIFLCGRSKYRMKPPEGNMIFGVAECIAEAFKGWMRNRRKNPRGQFLDYATGKVEHKILCDTRALCKILKLYLPFPIFWALFDQQGSRWTFQATRMNGFILPWLVIKPDQMQVVNPLLILIFIPLFDYVIYPLLTKIKIHRPLQKLTLGGFLAATAFLLSAMLEFHLEATEPKPLIGQAAQLRIYNGQPCAYDFVARQTILGPKNVATYGLTPGEVPPLGVWTDLTMMLRESEHYMLTAEPKDGECAVIKGPIHLKPGKAMSYFISDTGLHEFEDRVLKPNHGNNLVRVLLNTEHNSKARTVLHDNKEVETDLFDGKNLTRLVPMAPGNHSLSIDGVTACEFSTENGGVYAIIVNGNAASGYKSNVIPVIASNSVSILWQLPQIIVITAAEIMFSVTGLEFSFTQSPASMKSVLQACWLLSVAIGNLIVVFVAELKFYESQAHEFVLFALLMIVDMIVFVLLAIQYEYIDENKYANRERGGGGGGGGGGGIGGVDNVESDINNDAENGKIIKMGNGNGNTTDATTITTPTDMKTDTPSNAIVKSKMPLNMQQNATGTATATTTTATTTTNNQNGGDNNDYESDAIYKSSGVSNNGYDDTTES